MKSTLAFLVLVALVLIVVTGCAPGPNQLKGTANQHDVVAGFWLGLWHGFIACFVFVVSLFKSNLCVYEVHNNGAWYNLGYLFGLACFFGGSGQRAGRQPRRAIDDRALAKKRHRFLRQFPSFPSYQLVMEPSGRK